MARTHPWPDAVMKSFNAITADSDESEFYGPYNRVLNLLFDPGSPFEVAPQHVSTTGRGRGSVDFVTYLVKFRKVPIFFVEVKALAKFKDGSARKDADLRMRELFQALGPNCPEFLSQLTGISAFGTKLSFYNYDVNSHELTPHQIPASPQYVVDTAPQSRWDCDLLEEEGAKRFRERVEHTKSEALRAHST